MASNQQADDLNISGSPLGAISLWLLLFSLWLILNSSVAPPILISGALIALVIDWIFMRRSGTWWQVVLTPRSAFHFIVYTGVFFVELVKANLNMLRYVYAPRIDIHPGIVKINIRLKSPIGRLALANSIALTPGSLVMAIKDDALFIHWLDVKTVDPELASEMIAGPFEKHLGAVFG
ncbi:Na+/H+ antiporter subunit E [Phyllobacterium lublinensis]|uniref:Na+/H+ antiporter subunit E n=1 Tax=Phyllobacterium lublinensis TaxID=2875708 RepID=UPI001CCB095E|nr:Na+/H+ antiporter subunit E [Phyllobacterium sp. 2063]MBZ9655985.1 Na+/H+ antiporter subunit E [Phyllobacterium sp. 2063]